VKRAATVVQRVDVEILFAVARSFRTRDHAFDQVEITGFDRLDQGQPAVNAARRDVARRSRRRP
jgi:hypothetical protein